MRINLEIINLEKNWYILIKIDIWISFKAFKIINF